MRTRFAAAALGWRHLLALLYDRARPALAKGMTQAPAAAAPGTAAANPRGRPVALVPVLVMVDRPDGNDIREHLLYRLGDPAWEPAAVAARLCQELQLGSAYELAVREQIHVGLQRFAGWAELGGGEEKRVLLDICVRKGDELFRDRVEWDLAAPGASSAAPYVATVCSDLRLDVTWYNAIKKHVNSIISEMRAHPDCLELLPPLKGGVVRGAGSPTAAAALPAAEAGGTQDAAAVEVPCVLPYSAAADVEPQRRKQWAERLAGRGKAPPTAAA